MYCDIVGVVSHQAGFLWSCFTIVKLVSFALLLLYVTFCTMWRLYMAYVTCQHHLEIFSEM